jgi:DNA mismatch endonuclease, patch repair protein
MKSSAFPTKVSSRMQAVRRRNTAPEMLVKEALRQAKIKFRSGHDKHRPNSADILLPEQRYAIFVHGCFWHRHTNCKKATTPSSRVEYWMDKFNKNVDRDRRASAAFTSRGWTPLTIWECEARKPESLRAIINQLQTRDSGSEG